MSKPLVIPNIHIDRQCQVCVLLQDHVTSIFDQFDQITVVPDNVYVLGRMEMSRCRQLVRDTVENARCTIVYSDPAEGSHTIMDHLRGMGLDDLVLAGKIPIVSGGNNLPEIKNLSYEFFWFLTSIQPGNDVAMSRTHEIFEKTSKPYDFLFLNGRLRHHRKWLLAALRQCGLLDRALWSCLHAAVTDRGSCLMLDQDLMSGVEQIKTLPWEYEIPQARDRLYQVDKQGFVKSQLFADTVWSDGTISAQCYVDTYFSLVTETVFDHAYSFRTEKIWKPIMMGHPWVVCANSGFYRDLHHLGFKSFSPWINEDFDGIDHPHTRIMRLLDVVKDLCDQDLASFVRATQDTCKYNQQHFVELAPQWAKLLPENFLNFLQQHHG